MHVCSMSIPSIYIPHGGGPAFFMTGPMHDMFAPMSEFLASLPSSLPAPTAILVVSAHWEAPSVTLTGGARPSLIYDYYNFPRETYALTYPAPGAPAVATRAAELLRAANITVGVDEQHGWDHGVFIPLKVMYPAASVPVVAMSLKVGLDASLHVDIGAALRPLRDEGVLIVGSGMSYHNLREFMAPGASTAAASETFDDWLDGALAGDAAHRRASLAKWASAPAARASHPREEHLLPLMVASGAGGDAAALKVWSGLVGKTRVSAWSFS